MLILSPQRHSAEEGEKEVENVTRLRKLDGHCSVCECVNVCVHASQKIRVTDISSFPIFTLLPCPLNYICAWVCVGVHFVGAGGKFWRIHAFVLFWYPLLGCFLPSPSVFQINPPSLAFSSFLCSLTSTSLLAHVRNVIMLGDRCGGKAGDQARRGL